MNGGLPQPTHALTIEQSSALTQVVLVAQLVTSARQLVQAHRSKPLRAVCMHKSSAAPEKPAGGQYQNWVEQPSPHVFASGAQPHSPFVHAYAEVSKIGPLVHEWAQLPQFVRSLDVSTHPVAEQYV